MKPNNCRVVGLTGGIACGKSTMAAMLRNMGVPVADADAVSRELTAPGGAALPAVRARFGDRVFLQNGTLNRAALAEIVFGREEERRDLERIIHPMVIQAIQARVNACDQPVIVLDVPLLFESGMDQMCDEVWCAYAPLPVQLKRLCARDHMSLESAISRINAQMPPKEKAQRADAVIDTSQPMTACRARVEELYARARQSALAARGA